jgi:hypothetical protein
MALSRPFAYNDTGSPISGTQNAGLAFGGFTGAVLSCTEEYF